MNPNFDQLKEIFKNINLNPEQANEIKSLIELKHETIYPINDIDLNREHCDKLWKLLTDKEYHDFDYSVLDI